jgi:beta-phosphoglucomutase family hydrolase
MAEPSDPSEDRPQPRPDSTAVRWDRFDAVLFDLDGVLTPTADVHRRAWKTMFDEFLASRGRGEPPFTDDDYLRFVDGKPRYDGVRSFLASRSITLPDGEPSEPAGTATVAALGNRKNELFAEVLRRDGMAPYPGSIAVLDALAATGTRTAVVSSSRNAPDVLRAAQLDGRFDVVVDGNVAAEAHLAGKPAPDMFLEAARRLGVTPDRAAVVEDAVSGVAAGRAGDFALVLGVDRGGNREGLFEHGADQVVDDLAETMAEPEPMPTPKVEPTDDSGPGSSSE